MKQFLLAAAMLAVGATVSAQNPDALYLVGSMNSWTLPTSEYILNPTGQAGVYSGTFDIQANQLEFKIFTVNETRWNDPSLYYGATESGFSYTGSPVTVNLTNDGNNISCTNWNGGSVTITTDLNAKTVTFTSDAAPREYPEHVWLTGAFNGWATPADGGAWVLDPVDGQAGVYTGTYSVNAGEMTFKLFTAVAGWDDTDSYFGTNSGSVEIFADSPASVRLGDSQSADITCTNWEGGDATFTFNYDMKSLQVAGPSQPAEPSRLFLIGSPSGWNISDGSMALVEKTSGVFFGSFDFPAGDNYFRFYTRLGDWGSDGQAPSLGANAIDGVNTDITSSFIDGVCMVPAVWGKGCWVITGWKGGSLDFKVDTNAMTVEITDPTLTSLDEALAADLTVKAAGDLVSFSTEARYTVVALSGVTVMNGCAASVDLSALASGVYVVCATDTAGHTAVAKIVK